MAADNTSLEIAIKGKMDASVASSVALAKAQYQSLTNEVNNLARSMVASGQTENEALQNTLGMISTEAATAKARYESLTESTRRLSFATAGARREIIVLAHELSVGNFSRIPGSLMVLSERMGGLSLAALGTYGAVAALAGGLAYLAYQAIEAEKQTRSLAEAFVLTGRGATANEGFIRQQVALLQETADISASGARKLLAWEAADARFTATFINSANQIYGVIKSTFGDQAEEVFKRLVTQIAGLTEKSLPELNAKFLNLTPTQYEVIDSMLRLGDVTGAQQKIFEILGQRGGRSIQSIREEIGKLENQAIELTATMKVLSTSASESAAIAASRILLQIREIEQRIRDLRQSERKESSSNEDTILSSAINSARTINAEYDKRAEVLQKIKALQDALSIAQKKSDTQAISDINEAIRHEQDRLSQIQIDDNEKVYRNFVSKEEAKLAAFRQGSAERIRIDQQIVNEAARLFGKESTQYAQALARMQQDQRVFSEQKTREIEKENRKVLSDILSAESQIRQIMQEDAASQIQMSRSAMEEKIRGIETALSARRISADRAYQIELDLLNKEAELEISRLRMHQKANKNDIRIYNEDAKKILEVYRWLFNQIDQLQNKTFLREQQRIKSFSTSISQSFGSAIQGLLAGTETWQQAILGVLNGILSAFINIGEEIFQTWLEDQIMTLLGIKTTSAESSVGQILDAAAVASANTFASIAAIPIVGPGMAPEAAAASYATVSAMTALTGLGGLAVGTGFVPEDMATIIHRGEIIVPRTFADEIRSGRLSLSAQSYEPGSQYASLRNTGAVGGAGTPSAAGAFHSHVTVNQHNNFQMPVNSIQRTLKNRTLIRQIARDVGRIHELDMRTRGRY